MGTNVKTETGRSRSYPLPRLKVFILYEDRTIGMRAKECLEHFLEGENIDLEYSLDVCRFDVLEVEDVRRSMLQQSGGADVVVVAMHSNRDFPAGAQDWLNNWMLLKEDRPCALVVLICDSTPSIMAENRRRLDILQIPPHANIQILECVRSIEQTSLDLMLNQLNYRESSSSAVLKEILRQREPFSHWGINE